MTISFDETTSREITALASAEGTTTEQWLNRYAIGIHRAVRDRGGIEAMEAEIAAIELDGTPFPTGHFIMTPPPFPSGGGISWCRKLPPMSGGS